MYRHVEVRSFGLLGSNCWPIGSLCGRSARYGTNIPLGIRRWVSSNDGYSEGRNLFMLFDFAVLGSSHEGAPLRIDTRPVRRRVTRCQGVTIIMLTFTARDKSSAN